MKIGDYARTNYGTIFKIKNMKEIDVDGTWFKSKVKENSIIKELPRFNYSEEDEIINKTSPNITDLIEVGDYVDGCYIQKIHENKNGIIICLLDSDYECYSIIREEEIQTILTKEQFKSMEYKVGEDNE